MSISDKPPDSPADQGADGRWMSFADLAASRGISKDSAQRLVRRRGWRRQPDNQGRVRVLVPPHALEEPVSNDLDPTSAPDRHSDKAPDMSRMIAAVEGAVSALRERAEVAEQRADRAEAEARSQRERADQAERRADAASLRAEQAEQRATAAEIAQAEAEADVAQGREAREMAERAAEQARQEVEAVRQATQAREAADRAAQVTMDAREAQLRQLSQSDAARRSLGRWARLRAAWRGQ
jgi:membrane protein involved in colicin uptake